MAEEMQQMSAEDILNELTSRIRILESKQTTFNERLLLVNQNMIEQFQKTTKDIKSINMELQDLKKDLFNAKHVVKHLSEEASGFAKKESLKILEKYINLWNPLNFVTETDLERVVEEKIKNARRRSNR